MKVRANVGMFTKSFLSNDFYFIFMLGLMDFSDIQQYCVVDQIVVANKTISVLITFIIYFP